MFPWKPKGGDWTKLSVRSRGGFWFFQFTLPVPSGSDLFTTTVSTFRSVWGTCIYIQIRPQRPWSFKWLAQVTVGQLEPSRWEGVEERVWPGRDLSLPWPVRLLAHGWGRALKREFLSRLSGTNAGSQASTLPQTNMCFCGKTTQSRDLYAASRSGLHWPIAREVKL